MESRERPDPKQGYGLPLRCEECLKKGEFFGMLKVPGNKAVPCPNCGAKLTAYRSRRR
jgi:hypothetical protein